MRSRSLDLHWGRAQGGAGFCSSARGVAGLAPPSFGLVEVTALLEQDAEVEHRVGVADTYDASFSTSTLNGPA